MAIQENTEVTKLDPQGYFLEIPNEFRIVFNSSYKGKPIIATTEQHQTFDTDIKPGEQEIDYLFNAYNRYFEMSIIKQSIAQTFASLCSLVKSSKDPNKFAREYSIQKNQNLITVFNVKWRRVSQLSIQAVKGAGA